ncbi:MAG TPA: DUF302 domain-containing protein [Halobacteriales archaeon]|nr:DUF302 domain-containing protein [Halobacteriales archaeon]
MTYNISREIDGEFDDVVADVEAALAEEGFGVLCDVDVQATLREKLGEEFRRYRILGACSPPLAHRAMEEELTLGVLLPCNVVVYETDDGTVGVSAVDPVAMLSIVDNPDLDPVAEEVRERFERVLGTVAAAEA